MTFLSVEVSEHKSPAIGRQRVSANNYSPLKKQLLPCYWMFIKTESSATPLTTGVGEDAGEKEPSYTVGGNVD
jgi:hypothetical protein